MKNRVKITISLSLLTLFNILKAFAISTRTRSFPLIPYFDGTVNHLVVPVEVEKVEKKAGRPDDVSTNARLVVPFCAHHRDYTI